MSHTKRSCNFCNKKYLADNRNLKRGWGLCCSKSCAAKNREKKKRNIEPKHTETIILKTSKGYKKISGPSYDSFNCPSYDDDFIEDCNGWDSHKDNF